MCQYVYQLPIISISILFISYYLYIAIIICVSIHLPKIVSLFQGKEKNVEKQRSSPSLCSL